MFCACYDPATQWLAFGDENPEVTLHEPGISLTAFCVAAVYGALLFAIALGL